MAYSKDKLSLWTTVPFSGGQRMWIYISADAVATVNTSGYISDAFDMGMKQNDIILVVDTTNHLLDWCMCANAPTAASQGADLTDGLRITATNSD